MVCVGGYVKKLGDRCFKCEDGEGVRGLIGALVAFAVFAILVTWAWCRYSAKNRDSTVDMQRHLRRFIQRRTVPFRTLLGFVQVASRLPTTFRFTFPKVVEDFMAMLSFFELGDLLSAIGKPNCLFEVSYFDQLFFKVATPMLVLLVLFGVHHLSKNDSTKEMCFDAFVLVSFIVYPGVCSTLFTYFDCKAFEDGKTYLFAAPTVLCTDTEYKSTLIFVGVMSVLVPLGVPAWYWKSMSHMRDKLVPPLADADDFELSIAAMKDQVLEMYSDGEQEGAGRRRKSIILASISIDGESQLSEAVAKVVGSPFLFNVNRRKSSLRRKSSARSLSRSTVSQTSKLDLAIRLITRGKGEEGALQWLQELVRAKHEELKPTETLWSPYTIHCWWFEVYLLFSKLCLTSVPLLTRRWIPGLNAEAIIAAALSIGTVIFIESQEPYVNHSDSQMMAFSQGLIAMIIACGTGSTEISAGSSANQLFVTAVILGIAVPGTIVMAYSVADPEFSWVTKWWKNRSCAPQTSSSAVVHPSEGTQSNDETADTDPAEARVQAGEKERTQGRAEGAADESANEVVHTPIVSLGRQEESKEEQETNEAGASAREHKTPENVRRRSLAALLGQGQQGEEPLKPEDCDNDVEVIDHQISDSESESLRLRRMSLAAVKHDQDL
jgi:hypothetical protein